MMSFKYVSARADIEAAQLTKNAQNPHFKNTYANLAAHQELVLPILDKHGLFWRCSTDVDDNGLLILRYGVYGKADGELIDGGRYLLGTVDSKPQEMGSAITYARRYVLSLFFNLNAEDDDGNSSSGITTKAPATTSKPKVGKLY